MRTTIASILCGLAALPGFLAAETSQQRGKRVIDEAVAALGGKAFLEMRDRVETGRAYQFYREQLSGLAIAHIYTRYLTRPEPPVAGFLGVRERESFGKDQAGAIVFNESGQGYELTWRGARPLPDETLTRYKDSTLHNVLYILRMRLGEPGLSFDSQGSDIKENQPVEIVDITDADNRTITVLFNRTTKLPVYQTYKRRNPTDKQYRFDLAAVLYQCEQFKEAIPELQQAKGNPHIRNKALLMLGKCFSALNMNDLAVGSMNEAVKEILSFTNEKKELLYELGIVYEKMGHKDDYLNCMKEIYNNDYGYRDVAKRVESSYT